MAAGCESANCTVVALRRPRKWRPHAPSPSVARQRASGPRDVGPTSINVSGHGEAPAGAGARSRVLRAFGARPLSSVCTLRRLPHFAGKFRRSACVAASLTTPLRCASARASARLVNWTSVFVDARSQAASGRPRENAFFRVCPRARSFRASPSANVCYSLNRVEEPPSTFVQKNIL